jgi:copper chaperone
MSIPCRREVAAEGLALGLLGQLRIAALFEDVLRQLEVGGGVMSCDHCATSVAKGLRQVEGVTAVVVDLEAGRVMVQGQGFSGEAVRAAVERAGKEVVGA